MKNNGTERRRTRLIDGILFEHHGGRRWRAAGRRSRGNAPADYLHDERNRWTVINRLWLHPVDMQGPGIIFPTLEACRQALDHYSELYGDYADVSGIVGLHRFGVGCITPDGKIHDVTDLLRP